MKNYSTDNTQQELLDIASSYGVTSFPNAKNPSRPSKSDIIAAIDLARMQNASDTHTLIDENEDISNNTANTDSEVDELDPLAKLSELAEVVTKSIPEVKENITFKDLPITVKRRIQHDILNMRRRVTISLTPNAITQIEEEEAGTSNEGKEVRFMTWGNDLIGHFRTKVVFDTPWHIPLGLLNNLRNAKIYYEKKINGSYQTIVDKKYNITEHEPLTKSELQEIARMQQYLKNQQDINKII